MVGLAALAITACGDDERSDTADAATELVAPLDTGGEPDADTLDSGVDADEVGVDATAAEEVDAAPSPRTPNPTCRALAPPPDGRRATLVPAFEHLALPDGALARLTRLVQIGPDAFLAATLGGQVWAFSSDPARPEVTTVLDLAPRLDFRSSENGLVSIAPSPDFATDGLLYAVYIVPSPNPSRVLSRVGRFSQSPDGTFDADSEEIILDVEAKSPTHHGNDVVFGPDKLLYYAIGDDKQSAFTPGVTVDAAQDLGDLKGKILRLDPAAPPYAVPADNPFVGVEGARPEVFALGFRNPYRLAFGPDGALYVGDVGHDSREEIDLVVAGANYGWPFLEGTLCHDEARCGDPALVPPLVEYSVGGPKAVVLGPVVASDAIPGLAGRLLYADYVSGHVWSFDLEGRASTQEVEGAFPISSFTQADDGTIYVTRYGGAEARVFRLAAAAAPDTSVTFPARLSETGCVQPDDPRRPAPGVVAYEPRSPLWSDGAEKERYLAIPDDAFIDVADDGDLDLPDGSVLVKHFKVGDHFHETRLLMRHGGQWRGYSYQWDEAQTDATLLTGEASATLPSGLAWTWPSRSQCLTCHTAAAGHTLGLEVAQLDFGRQLEWLADHHYLAPEHRDLDALRVAARPTLVDPRADGPVAPRVRSYLHANCSGCHRPGGVGRGAMDLRAEVPFEAMGVCDAEPVGYFVWGRPDQTTQRLVRPGLPDKSILWLRMTKLGFFRMPPLGTQLVDDHARALVADWIEGLEPCPTSAPREP
ncbi:MAG: PQQ-dependent sugar dehydrogenase [Deltaproteobacteria bacterium]|nr:PQQ-dependent sugar dehydrogenase [Deltaproteobacteria bacterium]